MRTTRIAMLGVAAGAILAAPAAHAATITNGSPKLSNYRGKPVAVVFFHPL
jgi:hypothetical protein